MITVLNLNSGYSGVERYCFELGDGIMSCSNEFDVFNVYFFMANGATELCIEENEGCKTVMFPSDSGNNICTLDDLLILYTDIISLYYKLSDKIIVHINSEKYFGVLDCVDSGRFVFAYTMHYAPNDSEIDRYHKLFYSNKLRIGRIDKFITVTKYGHQILSENYGVDASKIHTIYNGLKSWADCNLTDPVALSYGYDDEDILILYAGRIESAKGVGVLASVVTELCQYDKRLHLLVAGNGQFEDVLNGVERNHKHITFLGRIDRHNLSVVYSMCDIGVIPSLNEQCSYVALEMMSHGMAIIASEVRGMGELFVGKDIALTVPVDYTEEIPTLDTDVLKQHITTLAKDGELRKRLGERARQEWTEHYTAERMARETMDVYRELAAQF